MSFYRGARRRMRAENRKESQYVKTVTILFAIFACIPFVFFALKVWVRPIEPPSITPQRSLPFILQFMCMLLDGEHEFLPQNARREPQRKANM